MDRAIRTFGFSHSAGFAHAAGRYWLRVFPAAGLELRRRRELALEIPDRVLRRVALQALESKRCNIEGAAAVELLAGRHSSRALIRALAACQTMCDYLDLLTEQPVEDPVANGHRLHEALIAAVTPQEQIREDYYAHSPHDDDGGYLGTLVRDIRAGLISLPAQALVEEPLRRAAERIAIYQSFNHGDRLGSHEPFERWARREIVAGSGMSWWETAAALGSTLPLFVLMACATRPRLTAEQVASLQDAYFPWIGALHTLLDSLVDLEEDRVTGAHRLIGHYDSSAQAAGRMCLIARQGLARAQELPGGRRHALLLIAMSGFYLCDARQHQSAYSRAVVPKLLETVGRLGSVAMAMMRARHAIRRPLRPAIVLPSCGEVAALEPCPSADGPCGE